MEKNELLKNISEEIMIFMRGKYTFDEIGNGKDELAFCENGEAIFKIRLYDDRYDFYINDKCISVINLETLNIVKDMILNKVKPNRKPFSKENAVYADCGHRCDLCVHYTGGTITKEFREDLKKRLIRVYADGKSDGGYWGDDMKFCDGCNAGGIDKDFDCHQLKCTAEHGLDKCVNCNKYPCDKSYAGLRPEIHTKIIYADDVTWIILPYVPRQYGN